MLRRVDLSKTVNVTANGYLSVRIPTNVEEGYTMSFLTGYALNNLNVMVYNFYLDHSTKEAVIGLKNISSSAQDIAVKVYGTAEKDIIY